MENFKKRSKAKSFYFHSGLKREWVKDLNGPQNRWISRSDSQVPCTICVHVQCKGLTSTWAVFCLYCRATVDHLLNQRAEASDTNLGIGGVPLPFCTGWPACSWTWKAFRNREGEYLVRSRKFLFTLHILILHLRNKFCYGLLGEWELSYRYYLMYSDSDLCYKWRQWSMHNTAIWHDELQFIVLLVSPLGIPYGEAALQLPNCSLSFFCNSPLKMPAWTRNFY